MEENGSSTDKEPADCWSFDDAPVSVFDQAIIETEKNPESSILLAARFFGAPEISKKPCKSCLGIHKDSAERKKQLATCESFEGWTAKDFDSLRDTCPAHYVNGIMEEREKHRAEKEKEKLKLEAKRRKKAKKKKRKNGVLKENGSMAGKTNKPPMYEDFEDDLDKEFPPMEEDDLATYLFNRTALPKTSKKKIRWECPYCNKSSKYSSCGCIQCGNWYHYACVGYRSVYEVPKKWTCDPCLFH